MHIKAWKLKKNDYSYKWSLYRVIRWKLLFEMEAMTPLLAEDVWIY